MSRSRPRRRSIADAQHTRAIGYLRVSTDKQAEQAEQGLGLDAQREQIEAYAKLYRIDLARIEVDAGISAKSLERPGLDAALSALERGDASAILVAKLDRLTRSVRDLGDLMDRYFADGRWALLSVADQIDTRSASGRLVLNVLVSVSQWEREAIGERTSAALAVKKSRGEYTGGPVPYGFRVAEDGVGLTSVPTEQAVIAQAQRLRDAGLSLRAVAHRLDALGFRARSGKAFAPMQIARIIERSAEKTTAAGRPGGRP